MSQDIVDWESLSIRAGSIFTPSAPINSEELFRGRISQVRDVVDAINQPGRHAILYGGRGVGKTSLGKILPTKLKTLQAIPIISPFITCDSTDDYSSIWRKVFLEIRYSIDDEIPADYDPLEDPNKVWTPYEVRRQLRPFTSGGLLYVVIDEFDKVEHEDARERMADTIKLLSDHIDNVTIIIIGVADDAIGLIDDHPSIERCLAQIPMPRMPTAESESIVNHGLKKLGMSIDPNSLSEIVSLSRGLPTFTHILALYAARAALDQKRLKIEPNDIKSAINKAVSHSEESIRHEYRKATFSTRETIYPQVLLACAMARTDEYGRFQPSDLCDPLFKITGRKYKTQGFIVHLKAFCELERGIVLKMGGAEYRRQYWFRNPLLQPYVLMEGLHSNKVTENNLDLPPFSDLPLFAKPNQRKE